MSALERNPQVPAPTPHKALGPGIDGSEIPRGPRATRMGTGSPMRLRGTYGLALGAEYDLDAVVLTGKVRYKGSMSNMYFYKDGMFNPSATLNLQDKEDKTYSENVTFLPHILEIAVGVLF